MSERPRAFTLWAGVGMVVLAALLAGGAGSFGAQEAEAPPPAPARPRPESKLVPQRQWEYMQLPCIPTGVVTNTRGDLDRRLNEHGKNGWELVSLLEIQPPGRECLLATFKRQVLN